MALRYFSTMMKNSLPNEIPTYGSSDAATANQPTSPSS